MDWNIGVNVPDLATDVNAPETSYPMLLLWFLPRDAMHQRYQPWPCVCLSVRLSVRHKSEFY